MKKKFLIYPILAMLMLDFMYADGLKNSLTQIMHSKDDSPMVNLDNLNLNAKPKSVKRVNKKHSKNAVVGTINNHKIIKKEADAYISRRTQGKISNYDLLPPVQKKRLLKEIAFPILAADAAKKDLTELEKQSLYTRAWMLNEARKTRITEEEVKTVYDQMKQHASENNATDKIPPFNQIKERLMMQMIEKKVISKLMQNVKIKVAE